jgi:nucleoside-diphosphate-sugar epimerase
MVCVFCPPLSGGGHFIALTQYAIDKQKSMMEQKETVIITGSSGFIGRPLVDIETEQLIHQQRGSMPVVYLRPAGVYDERASNPFLANQIAPAARKRPFRE